MQETHRPGHLKQQNKPHKHGSHRSKGQINAEKKGKVGNGKILSRVIKRQLKKSDRRHQAKQIRLNKQETVLSKKRLVGGFSGVPLLVSIVPIGIQTVPDKLLDILLRADPQATVVGSSQNIFYLLVPSLKQRFSFLIPPTGSLYATLDALKVSQAVIFLVSAQNAPLIDNAAEKLLSILTAQGLPSASIVLIDCESLPPHKRSALKPDIKKFISQWLPDEKVISVGRTEEGLALLRRLSGQKRKNLPFRDNRPHLLAEHVCVVPNETGTKTATVKISGYLRGRNLSVNGLVHIPGWGDYQLEQVDAHPDPFGKEKLEIDREAKLELKADPSKQISLQSAVEPNLMEAEQTWPTVEELQEAKEKKTMKRVPKGTSEYQACWIPDDLGEISEDGSDADDQMEMDGSESESAEWSEVDEVELETKESKPYDYDATVDVDEELSSLEKIRAARQDAEFTDEMDTPQHIPAKERFCKYRGLASFRTSPWDPKENLPVDYARIFQFENFHRTSKKIMDNTGFAQLGDVLTGGYVTLHVKNVPSDLLEDRSLADPLVVFGMLPHEHKMSVIHFLMKRSSFSNMRHLPIKSKDPVLVHCGFRRYRTRPIYSQHTNGSKHKFERFFQPESTVVASTYAPITFPPASVLFFSESGQSLLATGRVLSVDPDRLIIKRVVLSGHPYKVYKHSAVIRFMFFNREDIEWFKPVELRTKFGRRGHIKEPLGTHGHMKAVFDDQLKSQDTVLMPLYKRVFPNWSYEPDKIPVSPYLYKTISNKAPEEMECH